MINLPHIAQSKVKYWITLTATSQQGKKMLNRVSCSTSKKSTMLENLPGMQDMPSFNSSAIHGRMPKTAALLLFALLLFTYMLKPESAVFDADTGWHIIAGEYITSHAEIPETNIFSLNGEDYRWYNIAWLWDVIAYGINAIGGLYAVALFAILLSTSILALLLWYAIKRSGSMLASFLLILLGLTVFNAYIHARPFLVTALFMVAYLMIVERFAQNKLRPIWLVLLPAIMMLWVNLHGGFIAGFTVLGAWGLEQLYRRKYRDFCLLLLAGISSLGATLINPYGMDLYSGALLTLGGEFSRNYIIEWKPVTDNGAYTAIAAIIILLLMLGLRKNVKDKNIAALLLVGFWVAMGLAKMRYMPIAMLVAVPYLSPVAAGYMRKFTILDEKDQEYGALTSRRGMLRFAVAVNLLALILYLSPVYPRLLGFSADKSRNYPKQEIAFISKNMPNARLFNFYDFGGFIIYDTGGNIKTFVDGRAETAFPAEVLAEYSRFHDCKENWHVLLDKYRLDTALLPEGFEKQVSWFRNSSEWKEVYKGTKAVVFFRD